MNAMIEKPEWNEFLRNFSTLHRGQRTRLGVLEIRDGVVNDLWIEDGLPLVGIDVDTKEGRQSVNIGLENFRHSVERVVAISHITDDEIDGGIDIHDDEGKTTTLRFEDYPADGED